MRVGIVGVGFMGSTHATGWAETGATLAGFVARAPAEARPLADQYTGEDGYKALEVALAVYASAETGRPVKLPLERS